jgi:hypothetical protein
MPRALDAGTFGTGPWAGTGGGASSEAALFLELPKEKVRPARLKKPELDFGTGGMGMSAYGRLLALGSPFSCCCCCCCCAKSVAGVAEDGAVDTALWREDVSVDAVLVVLDEPLSLHYNALVDQ